MLAGTLLALLALAVPTAGACGQDPADPAQVQTLYAQGRYGAALELVPRLEDPVLAAEWRTYLALAGGDLPAALAAAREGLELAPAHRGLLVNAIDVALTLGLGDEALERLEALELALQDGAASPEELARADRLREAALAQRALERRGRASLGLARVVVAVGAALVLGAMLALALPRVGVSR